MAITLDATATTNSGGAHPSSLTWSHTVTASQSNLVLLVSVVAVSITGITYNSVAMTSLGSSANNNGTTVFLYYKLAPSTGANNVVASGSTVLNGVSVSYYNVAQSSTFGTVATNAGTTSTSSTNVTSTASTQIVIDVMDSEGPTSISNTSSETVEVTSNNSSWGNWLDYGDKAATGGTMALTWSGLSANGWSEVAVAMSAAASASHLRIMDGYGGVFS